MMRLEQIPLHPDWGVAPPEVEALFAETEAQGARFTADTGEARVPSLVNTSARAAWSILGAVRQEIAPDAVQFCEWGCGLGNVACLAARLGWSASGFDTEAALVTAARARAGALGLAVRFEVGDYGPEVAPVPGLFDADIIYAYAWPTEARWLPDRFARDARQGQFLVMYEGGTTVRCWRADPAAGRV